MRVTLTEIGLEKFSFLFREYSLNRSHADAAERICRFEFGRFRFFPYGESTDKNETKRISKLHGSITNAVPCTFSGLVNCFYFFF